MAAIEKPLAGLSYPPRLRGGKIAPMPTAPYRPHIRIVQSRQNSRVKELRAGFARGNLGPEGRVSIEGLHLLEEAVRSGLRVIAIFVHTGSAALLEQVLDTLPLPPSVELLELLPDIFAGAVATDSPQGIAALVQAPSFSPEDVLRSRHGQRTDAAPLVVAAAGLQDPGNLGTLIRSAEAFGATGLIALPGTVSRWNAKALRASSGSAFRLPVVAATEAETLSLLRGRGVRIFAATVDGGTDALRLDLTGPVALLIGNEGAGLSQALVAQADSCITVPCPGPVESLNAAVAGSVLLYEAARQRGLRPTTSPHGQARQ